MKPYTPAHSEVAKSMVKKLLELHPYTGKVALDLGCGNGQKTFPLGTYFDKVYGVDASQYMIDDAIKHVVDKSKFEFKKGDFAKIPVDDASIDVVTMWNSLHFSEPETLVRELARILKPTGIIYICEPGESSKYAFSNDPDAEEKIKHKVAQIERVKERFMKLVDTLHYSHSQFGYTLVAKIKQP